jgi:putative intracellular protease/amidase
MDLRKALNGGQVLSSSLVILFPLYPGVTQLDFTGPHQVLCRLPGAEVVIASTRGGEIHAEGGLVFAGLKPLGEVSACDVLCVPGGPGAMDAALDAAYVQNIRRLAGSARFITSVCTGSLILGAAGLLKGRRAACHWQWRRLLPLFGAIPDDGRVVRDGPFVTGGGVTAGIDFALTLAADIAGPAFAQELQLALEYAPAPPFASGRPETPPPAVLAAVQGRGEDLRALRTEQARQAAARLSTEGRA